MDDADLQVWLEETYDPDFDVDAFEGIRETLPGIGYEYEDETGVVTVAPRSELARLRQGRPDLEVQGTRLDNVAETFVEVDGQWFSIMINKDDLRMTTPGRSVLVSAIKVEAV